MLLTVVETAIGQVVYDEDGALYQTRIRTTNGLDIFDADGILAASERTVASGRIEDSAPLGDDDPDPPATGGGGSDVFSVITRVLTNAEFLTLPSSPLVVVPAPGAGKWLVPIMAIIETDFRNGFYTFSSPTPSPSQGDSDIVITYDFNIENAFRAVPMVFIGSGNDARQSVMCPPFVGLSVPTVAEDQLWAHSLKFSTKTENQPFCIAGDNAGDFGGGGVGNTCAVTVWYATRTYSSESN